MVLGTTDRFEAVTAKVAPGRSVVLLPRLQANPAEVKFTLFGVQRRKFTLSGRRTMNELINSYLGTLHMVAAVVLLYRTLAVGTRL